MTRGTRSCVLLLMLLLPWARGVDVAVGQDMEPRRWSHLPIDMNILGVGYVYTTGDLNFDPVLRIEDATVELHTALLSYNRTFALCDQTARVDVQLPVQSGEWDGEVDGQPRSITRDGLGDPRIRFSMSLVGAPALQGEEFLEYRRTRATSTTVGAALAVRLPLGDYMDDKLINLGENRFVIEPQLGMVHTRGPWSFEVTGSLFFYTENDDFFGGNVLEQDPLYSVQAHVVRSFKNRWWVSVGAAYGWDGESEINGERKDDDRSNLLYGLSVGFPVGDRQSMKVGYIRRDALENVGSDNDNFLVAWSIRF